MGMENNDDQTGRSDRDEMWRDLDAVGSHRIIEQEKVVD